MYQPEFVDLPEGVALVAKRLALPRDSRSPLLNALREGALRVYVAGREEKKDWYGAAKIWWPHPLAQTFPKKDEISAFDIMIRLADIDRLWSADASRALAGASRAGDSHSSVLTAGEVSRACRTFREIVTTSAGRLTKAEAYLRVKALHPELSKRSFFDRIWPVEAPEAWQKAGRPAAE